VEVGPCPRETLGEGRRRGRPKEEATLSSPEAERRLQLRENRRGTAELLSLFCERTCILSATPTHACRKLFLERLSFLVPIHLSIRRQERENMVGPKRPCQRNGLVRRRLSPAA